MQGFVFLRSVSYSHVLIVRRKLLCRESWDPTRSSFLWGVSGSRGSRHGVLLGTPRVPFEGILCDSCCTTVLEHFDKESKRTHRNSRKVTTRIVRSTCLLLLILFSGFRRVPLPPGAPKYVSDRVWCRQGRFL